MHLRTFPDHQKHFFKKYFSDRQECLNTCFDAFAHTSRPPVTFFQKRYFWPSGVVKNVFWCIFRILPDNQKLFFKKDLFYRLKWLKPLRILPDHQKLKKKYFLPSGVVKNVFWCICTCFQTTRNFSSKMIFLTFRSA
jgi:hypothetical protein